MTVSRRLRIERRLFEAVLLVLAGCQSTTSPDVRKPAPEPLAIDPAPPAPRPVDPPPAPEATIDPQRDPTAFCASHKRTTSVDASTAKTAPHNPYGAIGESSHWDGQRNVAVCRIVRDSVQTTVTIMHTPTCCPSPRGGRRNCPGPQQLQLAGLKVLVQQVALRADGSIDGASSLTWYSRANNPPMRHNCGRRPEGLQLLGEHDEHDDVGTQLAAMAELEAASVPAFERLVRELEFHGAPSRLVRRARAAIRDEIRHARTMTALAVACGATPRSIEVPDLPIRSLAAIAHENAVEGCVREAYGALVATHQAACAARELRPTFAEIATDERRHAALAEDVHTWIMQQLATDDRGAVELARRVARAQLREQLAEAPANATLGLPAPARAIALFDAYFA